MKNLPRSVHDELAIHLLNEATYWMRMGDMVRAKVASDLCAEALRHADMDRMCRQAQLAVDERRFEK